MKEEKERIKNFYKHVMIYAEKNKYNLNELFFLLVTNLVIICKMNGVSDEGFEKAIQSAILAMKEATKEFK